MSASGKVQCPRCKRHFSNFSRHINWCTEPDGDGPSSQLARGGGGKLERKPWKVSLEKYMNEGIGWFMEPGVAQPPSLCGGRGLGKAWDHVEGSVGIYIVKV